MAAEIRNALNVEPRLIEGSKGIFDVRTDGGVVYSKAKTGRFPEEGEVARLLNGG